MTATAVGRNVAAELTRRKVTHADLADAMTAAGTPLTTTQLGRRIRGDVEFSATEINAVARALGVGVGLLLAAPAGAEGQP